MESSLSETETINTNIKQKKRKIGYQKKVTVQNNSSHMVFFFRVKENDPNTAYCKICEINLEETGKTAYGYCRK
ncbi:1514_t:CDS:1, partial [Gigaspora margarita]